MEKTEGLRAGVAEMRSVAQRLLAWADDLEQSFRDQKAPEREVENAAVGKPAAAAKRKNAGSGRAATGRTTAESAADEKEKVTVKLPGVRAILAEKCAAGFSTQVKALIESYGVSSLKDVPPEKYGELLDAVAGLGAGDAAEGDADAG